MNLTLSIFDLFGYAIPGSLYLALLAYISNRLGWPNLWPIRNLNTTILVIGAALASYLLGHVTYQLGRFVDRALPSWGRRRPSGRERFLAHVPGPKGKLLVETDPYFLHVAAQIRAKEVAVEISRFRAGALMLRTCVPVLILASLVALAEFVMGNNRPFAASCSILFLLAALAALRHGREQADWVVSTTLNVAFWMAETDEDRSLTASLTEKDKLGVESRPSRKAKPRDR